MEQIRKKNLRERLSVYHSGGSTYLGWERIALKCVIFLSFASQLSYLIITLDILVDSFFGKKTWESLGFCQMQFLNFQEVL